MDFVKNAMGGGNNNENNNTSSGENQQASGSGQQSGGGGFLGGLGDKFNNAAGGGQQGEKNEDYLDKGMPTSFDLQAPRPLTPLNRRRLCPGELPRPRQAGQRERHRAGQGRADLRLHSWPVQERHRQGRPDRRQISKSCVYLSLEEDVGADCGWTALRLGTVTIERDGMK